MGRLDKLKREMITEANRKMLNETGPLNIAEGQTINLHCETENNRVIKIDGRVDVNSRDVSTGYRDERGDYVDYEEEIPQFTVIRERGIDAGVLVGQDEEFGVTVEKIIDDKLISKLGGDVLLTYYRNSSLPNKYYCKVIDITDQFAQELTSKGVKI
jgi:hypothetical protein